VTVSLVLDFMASASIGQWLEFRPVVLRHGRTLAFTECHVLADGELAARASATFRLG
jgi:acyl-coenzyme A thioesterase PaaI-like protein